MIGSLGLPELLFIMVLALLVFGPRKLPEIGRTLGRALGEFRRATSDLKRTLDVEMSAEERTVKQPPRPVPDPVPAAKPALETPAAAAETESDDSPEAPSEDSARSVDPT
jgi:TatA/E family protein of Tat protein translocase